MSKQVATQFIFNEYRFGTSKAGKPYAFVSLSNGIEAVNVSVGESIKESISQFKKGEQVNCYFDIDIRFGRLDPVLVGIEQV